MIKKRTVSQCTSSDYCKGWNDAIDEMQKWIDVNESLPDNNVVVLCQAKNKSTDGRTLMLASQDNRFWFFMTSPGTMTFPLTRYEVTHWQPLPKMHEERKNDR